MIYTCVHWQMTNWECVLYDLNGMLPSLYKRWNYDFEQEGYNFKAYVNWNKTARQ